MPFLKLSCTLLLLGIAYAGVQDNLSWIGDVGGAVGRDAEGRVVSVNLRASWVDDSILGGLTKIPSLSVLDLSETRVSDHGLRQLRDAPMITDLNLRYAELITDEGISAFKSWKHLKRLNLAGTKITDNTLQHLSSLTSLESLNIGYVLATDAGLDSLTSLSNLRELTLGGNKLTDAGLQALRQLPSLTYLDLGGAQREDSGLWFVSLTEPGLEAIATLKNLQHLRLGGTLVSARGLGLLHDLSKLEELDLHHCARIGDDAIPILAAIPALRFVDLTGTKVTAAGAAKLRQSKLKCRIVFSSAAKTADEPSDET